MRIFHNFIIHFFTLKAKWGGEPRFKKWILLEAQEERISKAIESSGDFPSELFSFLSIALGVNSKWFEQADWTIIVRSFLIIKSTLPKVELPILTPNHEKPKDEPWDYSGRTWHIYSHLIAKAYGWTLEEISQLQVEEGIAKIQEIIVEDQLDREFYYGLSEMAYHYDKNTKISKFVPLPRPHWMRAQIKPVPRFKIPKSMMPPGVIVMDGVLPEELMPKEIH